MPQIVRVVCFAVLATTFVPTLPVAGAGEPTFDRPLEGMQLKLRRTPSGRGKLTFAARDPGDIAFPSFLEEGAVVELFSPVEPMGVRLELPASGWRMAREFTVRFVNRRAPNDFSPLSSATVERERYLKVSGRVSGLAMQGPQGRVGIRLTAGGVRWCALFTEADVVADLPGRFSARHAPADGLLDCRADSLGGIGSPSGAFVGG